MNQRLNHQSPMNVTFEESLLYNDCELIFIAKDAHGRTYVVVHESDYSTGCDYIAVPATADTIDDFKAGNIGIHTSHMDVRDDSIELVQQPGSITDRPDLLDSGDYFIQRPQD